MTTSSINNAYTATSASDSSSLTSQLTSQTLDQEDFLQLLVAQLSSQDPLDPVSDTDFVAQMAQFSALEATNTMSENISTLNSQQEFSQAASLLGSNVQVQTGTDTYDQGVVTGMQICDGAPMVVVNGQLYSVNQILGVTQNTTTP